MAGLEWTQPVAAHPSRLALPMLRRLSGRFLDWEDWLTLALALCATLSVSVTLEGAGWSEQMPAITLVSVLVLLAAMFLARSPLPMLAAWPLSVLMGAAVTFWQTLIMVGPGNLEQRIDAIYFRFYDWFHLAFTGGVSHDSLPFNVLVLALTWLGVFLFGWSVFRWHNAWIGLIPGGLVLFLDLAFIGDSLSGAALLYVLFGFLLIMRTHLVSRMVKWRAAGISYPPLISLSFLHFSAWAITFLIAAAWIAPVGPFATPAPVQALITGVEDIGVEFVRLAGPLRAKKIVTVHSYTGILPFQGSVKLGERELLAVTVKDPDIQGPFILRGAVYEEYSSGGWQAGAREEIDLPASSEERIRQELAGQHVQGTIVPLRVRVQAKSVIGTLIFSPGQALSSNLPLRIQVPSGSLRSYDVSSRALPDGGRGLSDEEILDGYLDDDLIGVSVLRYGSGHVAYVQAFDTRDQPLPDAVVLRPRDRVRKGESYTVSGFVQRSTPDQLRAAGGAYPDWVRDQYLQLPDTLPARVSELARQVTSGKGNPYDRARAIGEYLRTYPVDYGAGDTPPGRDTVDYFLFDSRRGYFDYHASAMVVMLRTLRIPARLGAGFVFDEADLDRETNSYIVRDRNAYAWAEVYFPRHGWVAFNPTPDRPAELNPQAGSDRDLDGEVGLEDFPDLPVGADPIFDIPLEARGDASAFASTDDSGDRYVPWLLLALFGFLAALAGSVALGWQRSVAGLPYPQQMWEKTVRLASWGGYPPQHGQTPSDFAGGLQRAFRGLRGVSLLASAYNRSRFARREPDAEEQARIRELWPHLRGALIGAIFARLLRRRSLGPGS